jgi:hypothetical protein
MNPDQTARMSSLVWIHAGRKRIMLVLLWRGSMFITIERHKSYFLMLALGFERQTSCILSEHFTP